METYILRVYRRIRASPEHLEAMHGTLELVGGKVVYSFSSASELWALVQASVHWRYGQASGTGEDAS
jgi:hypothetical protein